MPNPLHCLLPDVSLHSNDLDGEQDLRDDGILDKEGTTFHKGSLGEVSRDSPPQGEGGSAVIVSRDLQSHSSCCYLR